MGILTLYGAKKTKGKFPHKQLCLHGIFPSIDRKKHRTTGEY
jgi:hypothetical protein